MNDLIRPTLYEAHHDILPVREPATDARMITADVVGPVCETGDYLALDRRMPEPKAGDLVAIMTAGAYGAVQSGTYNTRALVPEVLVKDDQYAVVRPARRGRGADRDGQAGAVAVRVAVAAAPSAQGRTTPISTSPRCDWPPLAPPTTTPAAFSIGLIAEVKSDSGPISRITASQSRPTASATSIDMPERLASPRGEPDVLHHQPGGEAEIEAARQHRARKLVAARGVHARAGIDHVDHHVGIEPGFDAHHHGFRGRDHRGRRQEIVGELHGLRRAGFLADEEHLADDLERRLDHLEIGARARHHHRQRAFFGAADAAGDGAVDLHDVVRLASRP